MARRLNVTDGYAIINAMTAEMFGGEASINAIDASTFVSAGEQILAAGTENVINTLSLVLARTIVAIRPYQAKFALINNLESGAFSNRIRKISYYAKSAVPTGASNTQLFTNLAMGFDNGINPDSNGDAQSTESQWLQSAPVALETNFGGGIEWQYPYTIYEEALKVAFRSPEEWAKFLNGFMVSVANDIESEKEAFSRLVVLNALGAVIDCSSVMPGSAVNLTAEFNARFNQTYTTAQLLSTYFEQFLGYLVSRIKTDSDKMENRSTLFHFSPAKTVGSTSYVLPRQTKKADQRLMMISKFWNEAEAFVLPQIFNDQYLKLSNFEKVDFWQNINDPMAISVTPAIPDITGLTGVQTAGEAVALDIVLGCLFDKDAIMVDFQFNNAYSTPLEARKKYRTIWNTIRKNPINDLTENIIVYYMADPAPDPDPEPGET